MKHLTYLFLLLLFFSCEKSDTNGVPAYIKINEITLDEDSTANITDAWVYINDQPQGVYELPAQFPVLNIGTHTLRVRAGIKDNGIAASRVAYPFYASYIQEEVEFVENEEIIITPSVHYLFDPIPFNEDFEGVGTEIDTTKKSDIDFTKITEENNNYAVGILSGDSLIYFEIATEPIPGLPEAGTPVYLELDYKCNTEFLVGVYLNSIPVVKEEVFWINPKEDWNKIYINLESIFGSGSNAPSFSIFIEMKRDFALTENELSFDNLKIVYKK